MQLARFARVSRSLLTLNRDREYRTLKGMLALSATDTVLDAGSGDGFWTKRLASHCGRITGVEPAQEALRYARLLHSRLNVAYVRGVAESLPFPNDTFDKVVSISCLEHFADPLTGLREMARVLKPGGRLAVSVDSLLPENSPASFREWHKDRHFVTHYFSQIDLFGMMQTVGLRCESERTVHLFRSRLASHLRQRFIRRPRVWLPLFPIFYTAVRLADYMADDTHGQIIIVTATRATEVARTVVAERGLAHPRNERRASS
jgi:ubiquinone/menaquinone biosynthesis C-methylase UbiE